MLTSVHRINLPRPAYPRERGVRVAKPRIVELLSSAPTSIRFSHRYRRRIDVVFSPGNPGPPGVIRRSPCIKPVSYRGAWVIGVCPQHRRVNPLTLKLRELRVHRDTSARKVTTWEARSLRRLEPISAIESAFADIEIQPRQFTFGAG